MLNKALLIATFSPPKASVTFTLNHPGGDSSYASCSVFKLVSYNMDNGWYEETIELISFDVPKGSSKTVDIPNIALGDVIEIICDGNMWSESITNAVDISYGSTPRVKITGSPAILEYTTFTY